MDKDKIIKQANAMSKDTLMETLGIVFTVVEDTYLEATMPVNSKVHQPLGLLHGGATVALAESIGSMGSHLFLDNPKASAVGVEINANHLSSIKSGVVIAKARIVHKGRRTHVWDIRIEDENGKAISICRITNMILIKD